MHAVNVGDYTRIVHVIYSNKTFLNVLDNQLLGYSKAFLVKLHSHNNKVIRSNLICLASCLCYFLATDHEFGLIDGPE